MLQNFHIMHKRKISIYQKRFVFINGRNSDGAENNLTQKKVKRDKFIFQKRESELYIRSLIF